ncbi:MAG TPA: hypothetical protein VNU97_09785 [Rhizomicrobium sp.]|jgi:hypothetical protein|nr:hypothetical protein [Rhizomicrobium sp.]
MNSLNASSLTAGPAVVAAAPVAAAPAQTGDDGFSFGDLLDIVNPLQHIPVVSTLYRAITGDEIKTFPKIAGDTLYGGITGFASSMADTIFTKLTGKSVGDTVLAFVEKEFSPSSDAAPATALASAAPAQPGGSGGILGWLEKEFSASPPSDAAPTALASAAPLTTTATSVASDAPALPAPAAVAPAALDTIVIPGQEQLLSALSRNGIGQDIALRAADAYRRTLNAPALRGTLN